MCEKRGVNGRGGHMRAEEMGREDTGVSQRRKESEEERNRT